jgi:hypothetical protein
VKTNPYLNFPTCLQAHIDFGDGLKCDLGGPNTSSPFAIMIQFTGITNEINTQETQQSKSITLHKANQVQKKKLQGKLWSFSTSTPWLFHAICILQPQHG